MPERRRKFTPDFKDEAVKVVLDGYRPVAKERASSLADIPPGLGLGLAVAGIDTARVSNYDRPTVALARRQLTHPSSLMPCFQDFLGDQLRKRFM